MLPLEARNESFICSSSVLNLTDVAIQKIAYAETCLFGLKIPFGQGPQIITIIILHWQVGNLEMVHGPIISQLICRL